MIVLELQFRQRLLTGVVLDDGVVRILELFSRQRSEGMLFGVILPVVLPFVRRLTPGLIIRVFSGVVPRFLLEIERFLVLYRVGRVAFFVVFELCQSMLRGQLFAGPRRGAAACDGIRIRFRDVLFAARSPKLERREPRVRQVRRLRQDRVGFESQLTVMTAECAQAGKARISVVGHLLLDTLNDGLQDRSELRLRHVEALRDFGKDVLRHARSANGLE